MPSARLWFRAIATSAFLLSNLVLSPTASADDQFLRHLHRLVPIWQGGRLAQLSKYIGTENNWAVLDDPQVADSMKWLLRDKYDAVHARLSSHPGVIGFYLFFIVLRGSLPAKDNHVEAAILVIDLTNGGLYAGLQTGGKTTVYGNHGPDEDAPEYVELPEPLRLWVADAANQIYASEPPAENFEWKFKAPPSEPK